MKILVVDPNEHYREMLVNVLRQYGLESDYACTACDGINLLRDSVYDLITISFYLPDMPYEEFVTKVACLNHHQNIPIYLITSEEKDECIRKAFINGITQVFSKDKILQILQSINRIRSIKEIFLSGNILYVEDSLSTSTYVSSFLRSAGLHVVHCEEMESAIQYFSKHHVDCVITDLVLAGQYSGLDLIRYIRNYTNKELSETPILVTTAFDNIARRVEIYNLTADDYIAKPVYQEELLTRLKYILNSHQYLKVLRSREYSAERFAIYDPLSNVHNRLGLQEFGLKCVSESIRGKRPLTLLMMGLDNFSAINEEYGREKGDKLLQMVGEILKTAVRTHDIACRSGGDEFTIILVDCDVENALLAITRLLNQFKSKSKEIALSACFGLCELNLQNPQTFSELVSQAESALLEAKSIGGAEVKVFL